VLDGILPSINSDSEEFWDGIQQEELRLQQCGSCLKFRWPPSPQCFSCRSFVVQWVRSTGSGLLRSWVTYRRQYFPEFAIPYSVGLVELSEGPRYPSRLVDIEPGALRYQMRLGVDFPYVEDAGGRRMRVPVFRSEGSGL
jgi:uncharacterized OB-fold protein